MGDWPLYPTPTQLVRAILAPQWHNYLTERGTGRPTTVTRNLLVLTQKDREDDISQYSRHVVSELSDFYPTEYEMLAMLASGNVADFIDLANGSDYTRHLRGYGLVADANSANPTIKIPMVSSFINRERSLRLGIKVGPQIVAPNHRAFWLRDRISRITADMRNMERAAKAKGLPELYGRNGFPEAERFHQLDVCSDAASYDHFINVTNRCFVEPAEQHGAFLKKKNYFWADVKTAYPEIWDALHRTKLYRHDKMHLVLKKTVEDGLKEFLDRDFLSTAPEATTCPYFALQQMVLDGLFVGLQRELERLT